MAVRKPCCWLSYCHPPPLLCPETLGTRRRAGDATIAREEGTSRESIGMSWLWGWERKGIVGGRSSDNNGGMKLGWKVTCLRWRVGVVKKNLRKKDHRLN